MQKCCAFAVHKRDAPCTRQVCRNFHLIDSRNSVCGGLSNCRRFNKNSCRTSHAFTFSFQVSSIHIVSQMKTVTPAWRLPGPSSIWLWFGWWLFNLCWKVSSLTCEWCIPFRAKHSSEDTLPGHSSKPDLCFWSPTWHLRNQNQHILHYGDHSEMVRINACLMEMYYDFDWNFLIHMLQ